MLSSLDALACKISPGSGKTTPSQQQQQQQPQQQNQSTQVQLSLSSRALLRNPFYQKDIKSETQNGDECSDSPQSNHSLRLNGNHHHQQHQHNHNNGLDSNGNKLCHITHSSIHPYQKQPNSPNNNNSSNHHSQHPYHHNNHLLQTKLANYQSSSSLSSSPPTTPLPVSSLSPQECLQRQQQHELFQQQLQQQQLKQDHLQQQHQQSSVASPVSPPTPASSHPYDENDSQHDFGSCLKEK